MTRSAFGNWRIPVNISTLKEFTVLVSKRNYTSAAKALYMSQSSLSRHMAGLEKELGAKLFFDDRSLSLTKAGEIVMQQTSIILSSYESMLEQLGDISSKELERIRIQDLLHFEALYTNVYPCIDETTAAFPSSVFDMVKIDSAHNVIEALTDERIDVGFVFNISTSPASTATPPDGFRAVAISSFAGELAFGIAKDAAIKKSGDLSFSDFADKSFLFEAKEDSSEFLEDFRATCLLEGFTPKIEYVMSNNPLDFYSRNPRDKVIPITRMENGGHTAFDRIIQRNLTIIRPHSAHGPYYVNATLLAKEPSQSDALEHFLNLLEAMESARAS